MIYISTGGFPDMTPSQSINYLAAHGVYHIELSGGKYETGILENLLTAKGFNLAIHNYFPPPAEPFVLNLASLNQDVETRSLKHVTDVLQYCKILGLKTYSLHGGFLIDPAPVELGNELTPRIVNDRQVALDKFIANLNLISQEAEKEGIQILVENNVISRKNMNVFGQNPLLMTSTDECLYVMEKTSKNVRLLVDVAHLKVSASTLNFDSSVFMRRLRPYTGGYHLSDNDGLEDLNMPFTEDSWFWGLLNTQVEYVTIEVYSRCGITLRKQLAIALSKLAVTS